MAGLMEGYLGGLQFMSGLREMQQKQESHQFAMQQKYEAAQENTQSKGILANVFRKRAEDIGVSDSLTQQNRLANQYQTAGTELMAISPKAGIDMLKAAENLRTRVQSAAVEQVQTGIYRDKLIAGRATAVFDQSSLDSFIQDASKAGITVPSQYKTWGPATEAWVKKQTMLGTTGLQMKELEVRVAREKIAEAQQKTREDRETLREKTDAAREERLRMGMDIKSRAASSKAASEFTLKTEKDRMAEVAVMETFDPNSGFSKLPPGKKLEAVGDIRMRAQKIYADSMTAMEDGDVISKEEALRQARESVLAEIKVDGAAWNPFRTVSRDAGSNEPSSQKRGPVGAPKGGEGEKPTPQGFNKVFSDADFDALPSGATFKGPDGVLRRKP